MKRSFSLFIVSLAAISTAACSSASKSQTGTGMGGATPTGPTTGPSGTITSTPAPVPNGLATACEDPWTIRLLNYDPTPVVPRRMYFASCTPPSGAPRLFVSATLTSATAVSASEDAFAGNSGVVLEADLKEGSGLVPNGTVQTFPECREMHGIAAKSDCSVVAVLCRRATYASTSTTNPPTKDMVAAIADQSSRAWLTQPVSADGTKTSDEEWLYEWPTGDITKTPGTYVASKAIGSWEYGSQYLSFGEKDNTYGLSLKSTVFGSNGNDRHEGDALLIVDRGTYSIDLTRGWTWGCATGHTIFNHLAYNPATSAYAVTCGTDSGAVASNGSGLAGVWLHPEKAAKPTGVQDEALWKSLSFGGGPTSLLPLDDGGYVGVLAGAVGSVAADTDYRSSGPVSAIGLVRYDSGGDLVGSVHWVVSRPGTFLSYPQLAPLGNGTFLLGYGEMAALADAATSGNGDELRIPGAFHVTQVDANGNPLGPDQTIANAGWGEQDQMVPLGAGRVGWAYVPSPAKTGKTNPACLSPSLELSVYETK